MKRTRLEESTCPVARSLDIVGDWWSLLIVRDALRGIKRFGEFQKSLGIAKNMLTTRLKLLVMKASSRSGLRPTAAHGRSMS